MLVLLLCLNTFYSFANLDSLKNVLSKTTDGEKRYGIVYEYAGKNFFTKPDSVKELLCFSFKDSLQYVNSVAFAKCLNVYAVLCNYSGQFDSMLYYAAKSSAILEKSDDLQAYKAINNMGLAYRSLGNYEQALNAFFKALDWIKPAKDSMAIAAILNDIGGVYTLVKKYSESIGYQQEALEYMTAGNNPGLLGNIYNTIGMNYERIGEMDSAKYYYQNSLIYKEIGGNKFSIANTMNNLCGVMKDGEDTEECLECYKELLEIQRELGASDKLSLTMINIAISYRRLDNCKAAILWLDSARVHMSISKDLNLLKNYYDQYSLSLEACGDYRMAIRYRDSLLLLNENVYQEQKQKAIAEFDVKYQAKRKDEQIQLLSLENANKTLRISNQKLFIALLFIFLISIIGSAIFYILYTRQIQIKKKEIELIKMREAERIRIARDMHDEIGSGLTRISFNSEQLKTQSTKPTEKAVGLITKIIGDSRQLSGNIKEIIWAVDPSNDQLSELIY
ncbi:MAG: tetratricopeptide repeat protein [Draconibacterium sp.]